MPEKREYRDLVEEWDARGGAAEGRMSYPTYFPYLLFAGETYHPSGGANDYIGAYPTADAAKIERPNCDWAQIAHLEDGKLVVEWTWETTTYGGTGRWESTSTGS